MNTIKNYVLILCLLISSLNYAAKQLHPNMLITKSKIGAIRKHYKQLPMLHKEYLLIQQNADKAINKPMDVPVPKGKGGSYSHSTHLANAAAMLDCALKFQISEDKKYARYVIDGLMAYAAKYKHFGRHPNCTPNYAGVLFFQELNENVWMVRVAQAYDAVYDVLNDAERTTIETELFAPMVEWASVENKRTFNLMHNHATWATAAVGMLGYATGNEQWVKRALYGTKDDGSGGFLKQLDCLFAPQGYYDEGPYYHRYALMPFLVFANVINNFEPERNIFGYRNAILAKAVDAIVQLSAPGGMLFHFNDADKDAALTDDGIVTAVDIAYAATGKNTGLLHIANLQGRVCFSDAGFEVARDLSLNKATAFKYQSTWFADGADGTHGGVAVLREGEGQRMQTAVLKASSQGQGHGHYDRLNLLWYDGQTEVFGDYGFARYVDIESKRGGEYLPENTSYAKQTVVHNTLTVDQKSHFNAQYAKASSFHPQQIFSVQNQQLSAACAIEPNAYPSVKLIRTIALIRFDSQSDPILFDLFKLIADSAHRYELPYWYNGQLVNIPFRTQVNTDTLRKAGNAFGYQHLWLTGSSETFDTSGSFFTFLKNNRYYTTTFAANAPMHLNFVMAGATDPEFSLRNEKAVIFSSSAKANTSFCSFTEAHDYSDNATRFIANLVVEHSDATSDRVRFSFRSKTYLLTINYSPNSAGIQLKND